MKRNENKIIIKKGSLAKVTYESERNHQNERVMQALSEGGRYSRTSLMLLAG